MSAWVRVSLLVPDRDQEVIIGELATLGMQGFVQETGRLEAYIPGRAWTSRLKRVVTDVCRHATRRTRRKISVEGTERLREQNWNAVWERSAGIVEASPRIIIKPSWRKLRARDRGKIVLHIDPKMSFGTGHHETTRLCLAALERHVSKGSSVLDVGTGTGVLAIAAVKLGARRAIGIDNDPWCYDNARENVVRNRVQTRVQIRLGGAGKIPNRRFNVVVANIDLPTITTTLRRIVRAVAPRGALILSGLLISDLPAISRLLNRHPALRPLDLTGEGEWIGLTLIRP